MEDKSYREFKHIWCDNESSPQVQNKNQVFNFCSLCNEIYGNLKLIEKYDSARFNQISNFPISSYIQVFDTIYKKFFNLIAKKSYDEYQKETTTVNESILLHNSDHTLSDDEIINNFRNSQLQYFINTKRFNLTNSDLNDKKFIVQREIVKFQGTNYQIRKFLGIKEQYFDEIRAEVNKILIMERELKFLTMKPEFWKGVAKSSQDINLEEDFCICGKLLFEGGWRMNSFSNKVQDFSKEKIYQSSSILTRQTVNNIFIPNEEIHFGCKGKAFLVYKFDLNKVKCVSYSDAYSDELIDGKTEFLEISMHTNVQKIDEQRKDGKLHELFAFSPVFSTLNCITKGVELYNEVVMQEPEPIGVIAMNPYSIDFALNIAKQYNVDFLGVMPKKQESFFHIPQDSVKKED